MGEADIDNLDNAVGLMTVLLVNSTMVHQAIQRIGLPLQKMVHPGVVVLEALPSGWRTDIAGRLVQS